MPSGIKKVFQGPLDQMDDTDKEGVGTLRFEGNKVYKYLNLTNGSGNVAVAAGDVVFYTSADQIAATPDLTDVVGCAAGVAQGAVAQSTTGGKYGWVQVRGVAQLSTNVSAGAVGNALTHVGAADKTLDASALVTDPIVAFLLSTTSGQQKIACMFPF